MLLFIENAVFPRFSRGENVNHDDVYCLCALYQVKSGCEAYCCML